MDRGRREQRDRRSAVIGQQRTIPATDADGVDVACFVLVAGAALVRVGTPLLAPAQLLPAIIVSAALWSAGFALFAVRYAPILIRPRRDGKPG